ncbi:MAG TPA: MFS transporter, partial [Rhodopila sp.]|nr:MFS transporter [Rhodopila sp.]
MDNLATSLASAAGSRSRMSNVRWRIFYLLLATVSINYIDRASLSVAMPIISKEFQITPAIQGVLLSSFFWTYCFMQIPGGLLADRYLPRAVIAGATILWGTFAALGAAATGWVTMLLTRLGLGLSEGPIYPAGAKLIAMWMTPVERGRAAALLDGGAPLGTALGSLIIAGLIAALDSWRLAFLVAGLGTIACGVFAWLYIRNHPHQHDAVNDIERQHIEDGLAHAAAGQGENPTIGAILRTPSVWLLFVGWFCFNSLWYGFLTWVPSFLSKTQGLNIAGLGWATFLIFFAGFVGELTGGQLLDSWLRSGASAERVYPRLFGFSAALATISVFLVAYVHSEAGVITLLATTLFFL